ncbi:MAG: choice-of-anchor A family protein [Gemmatimonadales bacterium]|nr:choice-of-anchor A family protein [Gemmatimonadales bacterium]
MRDLLRPILAGLVLAASPAHAQIGAAPFFNVLTFGDFTYTGGSDVGGGLGASGVVTFQSGWAVASNTGGLQATSPFTLVSGVRIQNNGSGQVFRGSAWAPVYAGNTVNVLPPGSRQGPPTANPVDFVALQTQQQALSTQLAGLSANGVVTTPFVGGVTFTGSDPVRNVFTVAASVLNGANTVNINVPAGSTTIINVTGTGSLALSGFGWFLNGSQSNGASTTAQARNTLVNVVSLANFSFGAGSIAGSILAPNTAVTGSFNQMTGQLVAASYSGTTEFYNYEFRGQLPPPTVVIPEPATVALLGAGLLGLVAVGRRR